MIKGQALCCDACGKQLVWTLNKVDGSHSWRCPHCKECRSGVFKKLEEK